MVCKGGKVREVYTSDNERLIVALLKNDSAGAGRLADGGKIRPEKVLRLADRHMLGAIVCDRLSRLRPELAEAGNMVRAAAAVNMRLRYELKLAADLFRAANIDFLLIKGFAVDKSPLRRTNDIDILIREQDLTESFAALEKAGYRYTGSGVMSEKEITEPLDTLGWNNQFQFQSPVNPVNIEVHTNLFERDRIRLENLDRLLDNVNVFWEGKVWDGEIGCFTPSPEATLALLCVHATTKRSPAHNTFILRHAYDIAGLFRKELDTERFLYLCREWGLEYYACTALRLTALCLDIEGEPLRIAASLEPALTSRQLRLSKVHLRCYRGLGHASFFYRKFYAILMPPAIGGGFRKAISWYRQEIFPPVWLQESRFGVKRTSPAIFLTYLYGPFVRLFSLLADRSRNR